MGLQEITKELATALSPLRFSAPVAYVYNPLEYAVEPHLRFLDRFGSLRPEVLWVGMNPGPWGMAQTGIPFGAITPVKEWLGCASGEVGKPTLEHPKRPVTGFDCHRDEVSGVRVWKWAEETFGTPEAFFSRFFITNYCPLLFLGESGRNLTPDKLKAAEREALFEPCDRALQQIVATLGVRRVMGIGAWAEKRASQALAGLDLEIGRILHPSPASPLANRGWGAEVSRQLRAQGIEIPASPLSKG